VLRFWVRFFKTITLDSWINWRTYLVKSIFNCWCLLGL